MTHTTESFAAVSGVVVKLEMAPPLVPAATAARPTAQMLGREIAAKASDLLPLFDFAGLLLAGYFSLHAYAGVSAATAITPVEVISGLHRLFWIAAAFAPFILYDRRFAECAAAGDKAALVRGFARRFLMLLGVVGVIAYAGRWLDTAPRGCLALWLGSAALLTVTSRIMLVSVLRRLTAHSASVTEGGSMVHSSQGSGRAPPAPVIGYVGDWLPVTLLADVPIKRWNAVLKAAKDFALGAIITVMLLPVLACIALAIKLDSPGPVLFRQRRHGFNNGEFDIYKFRTMRSASEHSGTALQQTVRGDSRVTRVGRFLRKWSLDELPQVFNVLEGSMSLVGPRPHAVNMRTETQLGHEITDAYPHRHRVKPGITGWAQVNGSRGATDTIGQLRRRVELDLYYVENWSAVLDLKILSRTFREVLRATNAY